ncbi:hypothetical protein [Paenibacillus hunanensis]|uniref:Uncharacterized protein n=1 Tax=Paenibacillus hunanensis TaxID=539262 RepID=A0ABU1ITS7_9BACL|nr:hypothetical protein [Paenibacillus hunanensis]MDR6242666.1 hypothetical protein [Paenibacillus hunanensis]GGJ01740.1 hypothetical protein GCM10008022_08420 [Paenibacillus hunanensis]
MKRFRQIQRGEWKAYIFNSVAWFALALFAFIAWSTSGFGLIFFFAIALLIAFAPTYIHSLTINPRTENYRAGKGFSYYRISEAAKLKWMYFSLSIYLIGMVLFCLSDAFNWWVLLFGLMGAAFLLLTRIRLKADKIEMEQSIRLAKRLYSIGVLHPDEVIHAAHSNVSEPQWKKFTQQNFSDTIDLTEREKEADYEPLHLLVVTDQELVMCTKKPNQPFVFSTMALTDIRQLYVSASSYKEIMTSSPGVKYNQMLVIGNGHYRQYHFELLNLYGNNMLSFVRQLLFYMDEAHRRVQLHSSLERQHPAYVPFEDIPMLSSTDEVYLPFMEPSR